MADIASAIAHERARLRQLGTADSHVLQSLLGEWQRAHSDLRWCSTQSRSRVLSPSQRSCLCDPMPEMYASEWCERVVYLKRADKSMRLACRPSQRHNNRDQQVIMPSRRPSERWWLPRIRPSQHTSPSEVPPPCQLLTTASSSYTRWLRPWRHPAQEHLPQRPHPIRQPSGHRRRPRLPPLC
jgi:hypothetical protein